MEGFDCPMAPGASCVLVVRRDLTIAFYALDPVKGRGRAIGEQRGSSVIWSVSPDGARIAFVSAGGPSEAEESSTIRTMDVADGTTAELRAAGLSQIWDLSWSADGKGLFVVDVSSPGGRLLRLDLDGHVIVLREFVWNAMIDHPIPSPDGRYLAFEAMTTESNAWILENF